MPASNPTRRAALVATAIAVPLALIAGLVAAWLLRPDRSTDRKQEAVPSGPVTVSAAVPDPSIQGKCQALQAGLPVRLDKHPRRTVSPASEYASAWGEPAIILLCGIRPSEHDPQAQIIGVNGVEWVTRETKSHTIWTSISLRITVEVSIPAPLAEQAAQHIINPLAGPLHEHLNAP